MTSPNPSSVAFKNIRRRAGMVFAFWQKSEPRTSEWRRWQNERVLKVTGKKMIL
jgi:hypothetical protein